MESWVETKKKFVGGTRLHYNIVENKKKKMKKIQIWGPSEIHRPLIGSPGSGPMYRLNTPLIGPVLRSLEIAAKWHTSVKISSYIRHAIHIHERYSHYFSITLRTARDMHSIFMSFICTIFL
jgi:hypothetical protein